MRNSTSYNRSASQKYWWVDNFWSTRYFTYNCNSYTLLIHLQIRAMCITYPQTISCHWCVPCLLQGAFLDSRGLRNGNSTVRSRVSYLFTRFVKAVRWVIPLLPLYFCKTPGAVWTRSLPSNSGCISSSGNHPYLYLLPVPVLYNWVQSVVLQYEAWFILVVVYLRVGSWPNGARLYQRIWSTYPATCSVYSFRSHLQQYTETILKQMNGLLSLNTPCSTNGTQTWLTNEEQMFLYEVASQLIVNSDLPPEVCIYFSLSFGRTTKLYL